jgi:hypothetical protein
VLPESDSIGYLERTLKGGYLIQHKRRACGETVLYILDKQSISMHMTAVGRPRPKDTKNANS